MSRRLFGALLALSLAAGCTAGVTEVVVVVDTDLPVPSQLDAIAVTVSEPVTQPSRAFGAVTGPADLPRTVGVVRSGGALGPVTVRAEGLRAGRTVVAQEARFDFVDGQTRVLRLDLLAECASVTCGAGQTCARGGCRAVDVGPDDLLPYEEPLRRRDAGPLGGLDAGPGRDAGPAMDAGARDAGEDAGAPMDAGGRDAGRRDAGVEAGTVDAGTMDGGPRRCVGLPGTCGSAGASCLCDSCACDVQCRSNCEVSCVSAPSCGIDARASTNADLRCEASTCDVDATGATRVRLRASASADATLRCGSTASCELACDATSACLVECAGATSCDLTGCPGGATSCPGAILVCGRACP